MLKYLNWACSFYIPRVSHILQSQRRRSSARDSIETLQKDRNISSTRDKH